MCWLRQRDRLSDKSQALPELHFQAAALAQRRCHRTPTRTRHQPRGSPCSLGTAPLQGVTAPTENAQQPAPARPFPIVPFFQVPLVPDFPCECRTGAQRAAPAPVRSLQMVLPTSFSQLPKCFPSGRGKTPGHRQHSTPEGLTARPGVPSPADTVTAPCSTPVPGLRLRCPRAIKRAFEKPFHRGTTAAAVVELQTK